jgi:RecJ-like exonuclease
MTSIECPMCHGKGFLEDYRPGGYFSSREEQWYPLEQTSECPCCNSTGSVNKPQHENIFNLTPDYQQLKSVREAKRSSTNEIVLQMLDKAA